MKKKKKKKKELVLCHFFPPTCKAGLSFLEVWEDTHRTIFSALLQCGVSAGRASYSHGAASQVWGFSYVCVPSQLVHSFMHAEELQPSAAQRVDAGALWEVVEEADKEPRHGSECIPEGRPDFTPVAN